MQSIENSGKTDLAATLAYRHIRARVQAGGFPPDGRLRETAIARELKISRTPVREAIRRLERDGVLVLKPNCGAALNIPTPSEVDELYELRELLESHAVGAAAARATQQDLMVLHEFLKDMLETARRVRAAGLTRLDGELDADWLQADMGFHTHIIGMAGNRWIARIAENLQIMQRVVRYHRAQPAPNLIGRMAVACRNHYRILQALRRGDAAGARRHMAAGIRGARAQVNSTGGHGA